MNAYLLMAIFTYLEELTMKKDLTTYNLIVCAKTNGER
jgi:hypothetical protein